MSAQELQAHLPLLYCKTWRKGLLVRWIGLRIQNLDLAGCSYVEIQETQARIGAFWIKRTSVRTLISSTVTDIVLVSDLTCSRTHFLIDRHHQCVLSLPQCVGSCQSGAALLLPLRASHTGFLQWQTRESSGRLVCRAHPRSRQSKPDSNIFCTSTSCLDQFNLLEPRIPEFKQTGTII
jgi:hypothetical protein